MTAQLVEKALISSLGYLPEIQSFEEDNGLLIGVAHVPDGETLDEPGTHIGSVSWSVPPTWRC